MFTNCLSTEVYVNAINENSIRLYKESANMTTKGKRITTILIFGNVTNLTSISITLPDRTALAN